jgi:hypothetical protein
MSLGAPAQAVNDPLGAVLTVPRSDYDTGQIRPLDPTVLMNRLHVSDDLVTLSFARRGSSAAEIEIQLPPGSLRRIQEMNYLSGIREVRAGTGTVAVTANSGTYDSGDTGTRFYLLRLNLWDPFVRSNGTEPLPVHHLFLTEEMVMVAHRSDLLLNGPGFDFRAINDAVTSNPVPEPAFVVLPIHNLDALPPTGSSFRLTSNRPFQRGAVWFPIKQYVAGGFLATFQFQMTGLGADRPGIEVGADGFAFVIQNYSLQLPRLPGGFLGYHCIPNSLAVEFDTYNNRNEAYFDGCLNRIDAFFDPDGNHISVHTLGTLPNSSSESYSRGRRSVIPLLNDGTPHLVQILYRPGNLTIYLDNMANPFLEVPGLDLTTTLNLRDPSLGNGYAWLGFTAGTGAAFQNHDILNWNVRSLASPIQN